MKKREEVGISTEIAIHEKYGEPVEGHDDKLTTEDVKKVEEILKHLASTNGTGTINIKTNRGQ